MADHNRSRSAYLGVFPEVEIGVDMRFEDITSSEIYEGGIQLSWLKKCGLVFARRDGAEREMDGIGPQETASEGYELVRSSIIGPNHTMPPSIYRPFAVRSSDLHRER